MYMKILSSKIQNDNSDQEMYRNGSFVSTFYAYICERIVFIYKSDFVCFHSQSDVID